MLKHNSMDKVKALKQKGNGCIQSITKKWDIALGLNAEIQIHPSFASQELQ